MAPIKWRLRVTYTWGHITYVECDSRAHALQRMWEYDRNANVRRVETTTEEPPPDPPPAKSEQRSWGFWGG